MFLCEGKAEAHTCLVCVCVCVHEPALGRLELGGWAAPKTSVGPSLPTVWCLDNPRKLTLLLPGEFSQRAFWIPHPNPNRVWKKEVENLT